MCRRSGSSMARAASAATTARRTSAAVTKMRRRLRMDRRERARYGLLRPAAPGAASRGHLGARPARLGETDGDRLLAARHLLARAARPERPVLPLVHRPLHLRARPLAVS